MTGTFRRLFGEYRWPLIIAAAVALIHLFNNAVTTYGMFRDELYYIACSEHPSFGYVDHPPFSIWVLMVVRTLFGDSVTAVRLLPALSHAMLTFLAGVIAARLGGGSWSRMFSSLCLALAPGIMGITGIYSMNAIELLLSAVIILCVVELIESGDPRWWIAIGVLIGIGLLNKISMGWLAAGLAVGVFATPLRRWLKTPWPWAAAGIAFVSFLPYLLWNAGHDWAHIEFARNAARIKYASQNPLTFLSGLVMLWNPITVPVWAAGCVMLFRLPKKEHRVFGVMIATMLFILLLNGTSKAEYFNPAAVLLFASGAVWTERLTALRLRVRMAAVTLVTVTGIAVMPMSIDLLPQETLGSYMKMLGAPAQSSEGHAMGVLPQHFADRHGWNQLAQKVAEVHASLSASEREVTAIYAQNYGQAAAIDFFGKAYGLPNAVTGHNSYWWWGAERMEDSVEVLIAVGGDAEDYSDAFAEITRVAVHSAPYVMPYEDNLSIYVCRKPRLRIRDVWHTTRHYI